MSIPVSPQRSAAIASVLNAPAGNQRAGFGSFTTKLLRCSFTNIKGSFSGGGNAVTVEGLRMSATIHAAQLSYQMDLAIYGLDPSLMHDLSTFGKDEFGTDSSIAASGIGVALEAGDVNGMSLVFKGQMRSAWQDFNSMPDCPMRLLAFGAWTAQLIPIPPTSYNGPTDVAIILSRLADQAGFSFENSGVSGVMLSDPYLSGAALQQIETVIEATGIGATIDNGVLAIWPRGGVRKGAEVLISPGTGLIGYPTYTIQGIVIRTLFNPSIKAAIAVTVQSSLDQANGSWQVFDLVHHLESFTPNGQWMTQFTGRLKKRP